MEALQIQLAEETTIDELMDGRDYLLEQKVDGERALAVIRNKTATLYGRDGKDISYHYPEIMLELDCIAKDTEEEVNLDGEVVVGGFNGIYLMNNFSALQSRAHTENRQKIAMLSRLLKARFIAFDIIAEGTKELDAVERIRVLTDFINSRSMKAEMHSVSVIPYFVGSKEVAKKLFADMESLGLEGIMVKETDRRYSAGRSSDAKKIKTYKECDVVIIGMTSKNRTLSALITENKSRVNFTGQTPEIEDRILKMDVAITEDATDEKRSYFSKNFIAKIKYLPSDSITGYRFPTLKTVII